jgi:hypothetical protein
MTGSSAGRALEPTTNFQLGLVPTKNPNTVGAQVRSIEKTFLILQDLMNVALLLSRFYRTMPSGCVLKRGMELGSRGSSYQQTGLFGGRDGV